MNKILILFGLFFNLKAKDSQDLNLKEQNLQPIQKHFWKKLFVYFLIHTVVIFTLKFILKKSNLNQETCLILLLILDLFFIIGYKFFFKAKNFKKLEIFNTLFLLNHLFITIYFIVCIFFNYELNTYFHCYNGVRYCTLELISKIYLDLF